MFSSPLTYFFIFFTLTSLPSLVLCRSSPPHQSPELATCMTQISSVSLPLQPWSNQSSFNINRFIHFPDSPNLFLSLVLFLHTFKHKNVGRNKHGRGHVKFISCSKSPIAANVAPRYFCEFVNILA
jgi:hypothetical protein